MEVTPNIYPVFCISESKYLCTSYSTLNKLFTYNKN